MAIAFDNKTRATASFTTISFTTSGSDRALVIHVESGGADNVAATYNGVSLTKQSAASRADSAGNRQTVLTLLNPASGTNTLSVTGASVNEVNVLSYTGVGSISGQNTGNNTVTANLTVTFTVGTSGSWIYSGGLGRTGPNAMNAGTGVSNTRYNKGTTPASLYISSGDSGPHSSNTSHTWANFTTVTINTENTVVGLVLVPTGSVAAQDTLFFVGN